MSTRSFIAKQTGEDQYRTIYCHSDGYLTHNGALLLDYYNTSEKVDELLELGDLSLLAKKLYPNPDKPHSFDYDKRQEGVTVAYGRDRGEKDVRAKNITFAELNNLRDWADYVYVFTEEQEWKYFKSGSLESGLQSVEADLCEEYAAYGLVRSQEYYGYLSDSIAEKLKERQETDEQEQDDMSPVLSF